ncbi:MAG: MATE family efflux transporter, partial [Flavobacteriaceae bacterium]|nr:MATE family efflux transporter [Flavobacteriaceae bacterium]
NVKNTFYAIFWIVLIMQPLNAVAFVFDGLFKGLAEGAKLRNTLLIATFIGFIPTLLLGDWLNFKLYGVWLAFFVWMFLRGGILVLYFRKEYLTVKN